MFRPPAALLLILSMALVPVWAAELYQVVWTSPMGDDRQVWFAEVQDDRWTRPRAIGGDAAALALLPSIARRGGDLHVVWTRLGSDGPTIDWVSGQGGNWQAVQALDFGLASLTAANIAGDGSERLWLTFAGNRGEATSDDDVYVSEWADGQWQAAQRINAANTGDDVQPRIVFDRASNRAWLRWWDTRAGAARYAQQDGSEWLLANADEARGVNFDRGSSALYRLNFGSALTTLGISAPAGISDDQHLAVIAWGHVEP